MSQKETMEGEEEGLSAGQRPAPAPAVVLPSIKPIEEASKKRIVAGQAVFDLSSAVKELVDNAIDAQGKSINIRLFNQGIDIVEVSDDGCGIPAESRPFVALPHATSKIQTFEDIYSNHRQSTLGFRGEALFCLANLSHELVVSTRTVQEPVATIISYARDGMLLPESIKQRPKKVGTTVAVIGLLNAVPVRRADLIRRIAEQRRKVVRLVAGYAVCCPGIRFRLIDIHKITQQETDLLATPMHCTTLSDTISAVFGSKFWKSLVEFQLDLTDVLLTKSADEDADPTQDNNEAGGCSSFGQWKVTGYISKFPGTKERIRDEQLFSINHRPVDMPRFSRMFNEVWRSLCGPLQQSNKSHPSCILQFTLPNNAYDINVSPDKREVIMPKESELLDLLQKHVAQLWSSHVDGQFSAAPDLHEANPTIESTHPLLHSAKRPRGCAPSIAPSMDVDENVPEEENDAPNKFNRRYAFSHDVSKIRLQHQSPERIKKSKDECSMDARAAMEATRGDEQYSPEPQPQEPESPSHCSSSPNLPQKRAFSSVEAGDARSPMEDRLWRAAKRRFHDSAATETRREQQNVLDQFRAPTTSQRNNRLNPPSSYTQSSHCLERFGFRATQKPPSDERRRASMLRQKPGVVPPPQQTQTTPRERESPSKRVSFDSAATWDGSGGAGSASATSSATAQTRKDTDTPVLSTAPDEEEEGEHEATTDDPHNDSDEEDDASAEPRQPVVWSSLSDTRAVITAARKERLSMRDRRISFQEAEVGLKKELSGEEDEDEDDSERKITLRKADFQSMQVIGQFNMGFILARSADNHLWIMDQHACDEKSNFEKLVAETVIQQQPLIAPMPLELSHSEETCILDHMEIFEKNGFRFLFQPEKPPRQRLSLTSIPHSGAMDGRKAVQFGKEDVGAFCAILGADDEAGTTAGSGTGADGSGMKMNNAVRRYVAKTDDADRVIARLPKAIAMFASRACRSSIMIGTALSKEEMSRVVQKLSVVDHPWNCPHGRPTMQHAGRLGPLMLEDERRIAKHLAGPTTAIMTQEVELDENDE